MQRKPILWLFGLLFSLSLKAQPNLEIQGVSPSLYVVHVVQPKETWYSLGRLYNISPKELAPYNNADLSKGVSIGQVVRVPLNSTNFSQDGQKATDEALVPVYHKVAEKEWMYRISTNYNKVPIENLENWNKIKRDQVKAGMTLVVGYLKVKRELSALAGQAATGVPVAVTAQPKAPVEPPKEEKPITTPKQEPATGAKPAPAPVLTKQDPPKQAGDNRPTSIDYKGGYFKSQFENSGKSNKGAANIFRSTSGWNDGKYYALMDNVPVGTIVQVVNTANNKFIYAKVLGTLSDIRENAGLVIRLSNAGAAELGAGEARFAAEVRY
ncbi:LysM peptidoglycan-binding domain-containing protein [Flavihumibacter rivuli]|uniref:LysM peptidoglycan-binding domain-containing protein n=1 Tax=Flavihumibacter rivuli TaxID=2838156 RepID=UPI001BDEE718|nr:LysM peptidoglycan-binding domain-containing protein [Flavihumibacter rivuli]ULQ56863.1 LysM peptidoglycan-binding domain-containing protein [Flavihumibacter rivuli]